MCKLLSPKGQMGDKIIYIFYLILKKLKKITLKTVECKKQKSTNKKYIVQNILKNQSV